MEKAFMAQASKVEEVFQQNRDLSQRLTDLEKLWCAEEQFTMELRGRVESLQVPWFLWGVCNLIDDQCLGSDLQVWLVRESGCSHRGDDVQRLPEEALLTLSIGP